MKIAILMAVCLLATLKSSFAQKYISKDTYVWFFSHTPIEDIKADDHEVASILDISNGDLVISLLIKSFEFKRALMQVHFNEEYFESDKYPNAMFKGKITNLSDINFKKDGVYPAAVTGNLTMHGVTKEITVHGTIEIKNGNIEAKAKFEVLPEDYNVKIPGIVRDKIAKQIDVNVDAPYTLYK